MGRRPGSGEKMGSFEERKPCARSSRVAALFIAGFLSLVQLGHAQNSETTVTPCMKDGKPCMAPGPWTPGNLNLPLPLGIVSNSMVSSRTSLVGAGHPNGFFGRGMGFPFGYIQVHEGAPYLVAPDGTETAFRARGGVFESENAPYGDLAILSVRPGNGGYDLLEEDGTRVSFNRMKHGSRFYPTSVNDVDGHAVLTVTYDDPAGALFVVTDQLGLQTKFLPSASDRTKVGTVISPTGDRITLSYGALELLASIEGPGTSTTLQYDAADRVKFLRAQTSSDMSYWNFYYKDGLLTDIVDNDGNSTSFVYSNDTVLSIQGVRGRALSFSRAVYTTVNGRQMIVRQEAGEGDSSKPAAVMWSAEYNSRGLVSSYTDAMGRVTRLEYGAAPFPTKLTNPDGSITELMYGNAANSYRLNSITATGPDGKKSADSLTWSGAKLIARKRVVDGVPVLDETYSSNASAQNVRSTSTAVYSYDSMGRLVGQTGPGGRTLAHLTNGQVTAVTDNGVRYGVTTTVDSKGKTIVAVAGAGLATTFSSSFSGNSSDVSFGTIDGSFVTSGSSSMSGSALSSSAASSYSVASGSFLKSGSSSFSQSVGADGVVKTTGASR